MSRDEICGYLPLVCDVRCDDDGGGCLQRPRNKILFHDCLASLLSTQKNTKRKKPWEELNIAKRIWKASEVSLTTVRPPNTHVSPSRNVTPISLKIKPIIVVVPLVDSFLLCLMAVLATITNTMELNIRMAAMGPMKAPNNTRISPMKQLQCNKINVIFN